MTQQRVRLKGCMPEGFPTVDGHVVHPDYLPTAKRERYLEQLRAWVKANSNRTLWPMWLRDFWATAEAARTVKAKRASGEGAQP